MCWFFVSTGAIFRDCISTNCASGVFSSGHVTRQLGERSKLSYLQLSIVINYGYYVKNSSLSLIQLYKIGFQGKVKFVPHLYIMKLFYL